ncbi:YdeI/OmpD-associated family protein [Actinophytocola sp.]|uniref:YdeI/OmpD-associated family protein n=1 Tax=Actinophytocola sp. TaxID=1872138 RepID=UPI003899EF5E
MEPLEFDCTLDSAAGGGVKIPFDVRALFGRARAPVVVTVRAGREHSYRSTVAVYGGEFYVPLNKANATAAAVTAGEPFAVTVCVDDEPRTVSVPGDLATAIDEAGLRERWDRLSYSHQRENVEAVESAKKPETRQRRIDGVLTRLAR